MAVFDEQSGKLVARVIFDGPGRAGKTTNLEQVCSFFTPQRRSELFSGDTTGDERTLYLDWLQLEAGVVGGFRMVCHLVTVPGQTVFRRRRHLLLGLADTVVFVLDSTPKGVEEALPMWKDLLVQVGEPWEGGPPVVIQANKQDEPNALDDNALRKAWSLPASVPILLARADQALGVRETIVIAIRATADRLQATLLEEGASGMEGKYEDGKTLIEKMKTLEKQEPMSPAEVVRELTKNVPVTDSSPSHAAEALPASGLSSVRRSPSEQVTSVGPAEEESVESLIDHNAEPNNERPPLPTSNIPSGLVWPAGNGRQVLRRIPLDDVVWHARSSANYGVDSGNGKQSTLLVEAGTWCLKTSTLRCYNDVDKARTRFLELARHKMELGSLCAPKTTLAVKKGPDGKYWLWTVCLWLTTLRAQMSYATQTKDSKMLGLALAEYARLAVRTMRMALDSQLVLDVHPSNFGCLMGGGHYLDDDFAKGTVNPLIGHAILRRFDEYRRFPRALARYTSALQSEILDSLSAEEVKKLELPESLSLAAVQGEESKLAQRTLLSTLERRRTG